MTTVTPAEMLANTVMCLRRANVALSDARDWLASDWPPGTVLTDEQAARRDVLRKAVNEAKAAVERGLHG
jgi:hypothetical protein